MSERPQPSPEHVHAVAVVLAQANGTEWDLMPGDDDVYRRDARAILTSDDPAVHAALLAALTRAEVLTDTGEAPKGAKPTCEACQWFMDSTCPNCGCCDHEWKPTGECACMDRSCGCREAREDREGSTWAQDGPQEPVHAPEAPVGPHAAHDATEAR